MARFEAEDVLVAPVHDYDAVFADPQVLHNELVLEAEIAGVGPVKFVGMPVALSETPARLRHVPPNDRPAQRRGARRRRAHPERIAELKRAGVIGSEADRERAGGTARVVVTPTSTSRKGAT